MMVKAAGFLAIALALAGCNQSPPLTQQQKDEARVQEFFRFMSNPRAPAPPPVKLADVRRSKTHPNVICGSWVEYPTLHRVFAVQADGNPGSVVMGRNYIWHELRPPNDGGQLHSIEAVCGETNYNHMTDPWGFGTPKS